MGIDPSVSSRCQIFYFIKKEEKKCAVWRKWWCRHTQQKQKRKKKGESKKTRLIRRYVESDTWVRGGVGHKILLVRASYRYIGISISDVLQQNRNKSRCAISKGSTLDHHHLQTHPAPIPTGTGVVVPARGEQYKRLSWSGLSRPRLASIHRKLWCIDTLPIVWTDSEAPWEIDV